VLAAPPYGQLIADGRQQPKRAYKPSSVPRHTAWTATIHLGRRLRAASSDLPGAEASHPWSGLAGPAPARSCSGWGLPSRPVARPLVGSYPAIAPLPCASHRRRAAV